MAAVTTPENILDARLSAYEKEILALKAKHKTLQTDTSEAQSSLSKLTKELKLATGNMDALKTENKTLKLTLKEMTTDHQNLLNHKKRLKDKAEQLSIRSEENDKTINELRSTNAKTNTEYDALKEEHSVAIKNIHLAHAKEIGQLQIKKQNELGDRINAFAKMENNLKMEISSLQTQMNMMDREYKDTIAGQAQRLCAYEQQINIMDKQMNRLSIQNEFKSMPKLSNSDRLVNRLETENVALSKDNKTKDNEIKQLMNRLAMNRLNNHYDFRNKGQY